MAATVGTTAVAAAGGTNVRAATTAAVAGGMTVPVVMIVAAVGATTAPAAKAAAGATTGAATGVATTVEMTAAAAIAPTAVHAATIAPPTARAKATSAGTTVAASAEASSTRAVGATTTAGVGPAASTAATPSLGAGATRATPGMSGGVGTPRAIDRAAVIGPVRRTTVDAATPTDAAQLRDGPRRGAAAGRDGDRRRPYDRAGSAPRRDDRSRAGTSADGARTGDVREGRWSDTWSDRRRRDDRSDGEGQGSRERQTTPAPPLSDAIAASALDPAARRDLLGLQKDVAEAVARHLVAAGTLVDEDPEAALAHARYARRRASRIAVVREAAGITAYHAGEWAEALAELRAARRMGGGPGHLAVMADIERAMGRPERAIELSRSPEARELDRNAQIELAIVVAGARRDLDEIDAAVVALQVPELEASRRDPWSARLFYAYADNLLAAGRESDALQWFVHAADADTDGETDADVRIADLTGEPLADDGIEFGLDDETPGDAPAAEDSPADNAAAPTDHTAEDADTPSDEAAEVATGETADKAAGVATDERADKAAGVATDERPTRRPRSRRTRRPTRRPGSRRTRRPTRRPSLRRTR